MKERHGVSHAEVTSGVGANEEIHHLAHSKDRLNHCSFQVAFWFGITQPVSQGLQNSSICLQGTFDRLAIVSSSYIVSHHQEDATLNRFLLEKTTLQEAVSSVGVAELEE